MAINRAGFNVSKEKTFPYVIIPSENNKFWQLSNQTGILEFSTIYELITYLSR
jgi:hypothetical protein